MEDMNNSLSLTDDNKNLIMEAADKKEYCSMVCSTMEEKKMLFNAITNPNARLKDMINMEIDLRHVYAETCNFVSREDGTVQEGVRMVLITDDGSSYQCASKGVFNSITKLFKIVGEPNTWDGAVKIRVKQISMAADKNVLIFELV